MSFLGSIFHISFFFPSFIYVKSAIFRKINKNSWLSPLVDSKNSPGCLLDKNSDWDR